MPVPAADRIPNRTLKAVRLALRISQSEFASAIRYAGDALGEPNTCNKRLVQKWESGEHAVCRPNYRRALQSVTRTPYEQLGFAGAPSASLEVAAVPRVRAAEVIQPADVVMVAELGERLRYALERPEQADAETVAMAETAVAHLFDLERHRPARLLAPAVSRHTAEIAALLAGTRRDQLRRRLAVAGGQCAALAGWLAFDRGQAQSAHRYWDSALAAAQYATNGPLLACTLTYLSYSAEERGDPATAWQFAHRAVAHAGTESRARSWMAARAAEQAAVLGEKTAALAELELAISLAGSLTPVASESTSVPPWVRYFDRCTLATMAATVHGRLGDVKAAREAAGWALRTLGEEQVKSRAVALAEIACAAARTGELHLVADSAPKAAELAERLEVTVARRKLRTLIPLLADYRNTAPIRDLLGWLAG
jgi:transcriptional regulator with XRE-family HTH domain